MASKRRIHTLFLFLITVVALLHIMAGLAQGQITLDGSLGPAVSLAGPDYEITADLGRIAGSNLFHSFDAFNFFAGESATFTGPNAVENVIGRVTGDGASFIDGPLGCAIPDANLYLLNPGGVVFGPNASLDVGGSFHVSAGDYIRLGNEGIFYADLSNNTSLAAAPPSAFGFLGDSPGGVSIQECELRVLAEESISVVGGDIEIVAGRLVAPGGRLHIGGVGSPGEILPDNADQAPDLQMAGFSNLGDIHISDSTLTAVGETSGSIFIRGDDMDLDGAEIYTTTRTPQAAGDINIRLTGDLRMTSGANIDASSYWTGPVGNILIDARRLEVVEGSRITTHAKEGSQDQAGDITISTAESVVISGGWADGMPLQSAVFSGAFGKGDAGGISISTPELIIEDGAGIFSMVYYGFDMFGNVVTGGDAGDILLDVGRLEVNGSRILSYCGGMTTGLAGDITINASESASIFNSSFIDATTYGAGGGGTIRITTPNFEIENSVMEASTHEWSQGKAGDIILDIGCLALINNAGISTHTEGAGDAGELLLTAGRLNLINGGQISSSTAGPGAGNHVTVDASEGVLISGQSPDGYTSAILSGSVGDGDAGVVSILSPELTLIGGVVETGSSAKGDAGGINVDVERLTLENGGRLQGNTTGEGHGGAIHVTASDSVFISDKDDTGYPGGIHSVAFGDGAGGNIEIRGGRVLQVTDGALISAESMGNGDAGNIALHADDLLFVENGSVWTEARQSDGGDIRLTSGNMVHLREGEISASVNGGPETKGGNIHSESGYMVLEKSAVTANAYEGAGGNIRIVADVFLADPGSVVDASSALGIDGRVDIQAPIKNISGAIAPLRENFLNAAALLREPCAARIREGKYNSLVIGGRDGLPLEPGGPLPSPLF